MMKKEFAEIKIIFIGFDKNTIYLSVPGQSSEQLPPDEDDWTPFF